MQLVHIHVSPLLSHKLWKWFIGKNHKFHYFSMRMDYITKFTDFVLGSTATMIPIYVRYLHHKTCTYNSHFLTRTELPWHEGLVHRPLTSKWTMVNMSESVTYIVSYNLCSRRGANGITLHTSLNHEKFYVLKPYIGLPLKSTCMKTTTPTYLIYELLRCRTE